MIDAPPPCVMDTFDGAALDTTIWETPSTRPSITLSQNAGLAFAYGDDGGTGLSLTTSIRSLAELDMTERAITAQLMTAPTANNTVTRVDLFSGGLALFKLEAKRDAAGAVSLACIAGATTIYSGVSESHVRLRFTADEVICETSGNGTTFVERGRRMVFAPLGARVVILGGVEGMVTGPGTAVWRQVTTCP